MISMLGRRVGNRSFKCLDLTVELLLPGVCVYLVFRRAYGKVFSYVPNFLTKIRLITSL